MLSQRKSIWLLGTALWAATSPAQAQDGAEAVAGSQQTADDSTSDDNLLDVSLEDLLVLESTSVAKKRQSVSDSAAAVYVMSQEEIRNSAASTIPDLLRSVPGLEVGQIANGVSAVSIRGFNGRNSNSLLVMVDGRTVYVSTLSGVFWDQLNLPLQDIERIEVVRGPGATLWGANAVNGVINIITKNSSDSLGTRVHARLGDRRQEAALSYGTRIGEDAALRVHGAYRREEGLQRANGDDLGTAANSGEIGIRVDWAPNDRDAFTFQADFAAGSSENIGETLDTNLINPAPIEAVTDFNYDQTNVLARWTRQQSDDLEFSLQGYYSNTRREESILAELDWSIADLDFGANWRPNETHDINFGVNARAIWDEFKSTGPQTQFRTTENTDLWISGYIQDDISLIQDTLRLTLGAKLERNDFTGFEFQPGARIFYRPSKSIGIWGAVTRAVRTPSRFERDADLRFSAKASFTRDNPSPLPVFSRTLGSEALVSENVTAFEAGFRADIAPSWNLDVAAYYNRYSHLNEPTTLAVAPIFVQGVPFPVSLDALIELQSRGKAETWGFEAVLKGEIAPWWQTQLSYSNFNGKAGVDPFTGAPFRGFLALEGSPEHQAAFTNDFSIGRSFTLNTQLRYVDSMLFGDVQSYVDGDIRLRYEAPNGLDLSLVGENLFDARRLEFLQDSYPAPASFNPRSVSVEARFRF